MSINDIPALAALRTKMQWHQERQRVLADNVANSDTPNFKPRDLVEPKFDASGANAGGALPYIAYRTSLLELFPAVSRTRSAASTDACVRSSRRASPAP